MVKGGEVMKYIKIHCIKDTYSALPAEKRAELTASAMAFADKYKKAGKMQEYFFMADGSGGFAIWDVAFNEELYSISLEYPLRPYTDFETYPVVDYAAAAQRYKESVTARKAP